MFGFHDLPVHRCLSSPPPLPRKRNRSKHPGEPVHQRVHNSSVWPLALTKLALSKLILTELALSKLILTELALRRKLVLPKLGLTKLVLSHKLTLLKLVLRSKVGLELVDVVLLAGQLLDELLPVVEELLARLEDLLPGLEQTLTAGTKLGCCGLHQWTALPQLGLWQSFGQTDSSVAFLAPAQTGSDLTATG